MEAKAIGAKVEEVRKEKGFSRKETAKAIGISDERMKKIESGEGSVDIFDGELMGKLEGFLEAKPEDLGFQSEFECRLEAIVLEIVVEHSEIIRWVYTQDADQLASLFIDKGVGGAAATIADHICNKFLANAKLPQLREIALHSVASDKDFFDHVHDIVFKMKVSAARVELDRKQQLDLPFDEPDNVSSLEEKRKELKAMGEKLVEDFPGADKAKEPDNGEETEAEDV